MSAHAHAGPGPALRPVGEMAYQGRMDHAAHDQHLRSAARSSGWRTCASCAAAASSSTMCRPTACCTPRSCAARSRTAASVPIDVRAARARPACTRSSRRRTSATSRSSRCGRSCCREFKPYQQPVIASGKVRYVGEPIAVVVADSAALAEDALEAIDVDIEPLPAVPDRARRAPGRHAAVRGDRHEPRHHADGVARRRRRRVRGRAPTSAASASRCSASPRCRWSRAACSPTGTQRDRRLTVYGATKVPFHNRRMLAKQMGLPRTVDQHDRVRRRRRLRRARRVLSRGFPHSVRGAPSRPAGEMDRGPPRASDRHQSRARRRMRAGDRLRARRHHPRPARARARSISAPISAPTARPRRATSRRCCPGPTAFRTSTSTSTLLVTNKTPSGTYRGPGRFEADFFRERLFDMAARDLGIDRVEFRRRNLIAEAEMPYALADAWRRSTPSSETDSGDYRRDARSLPRRVRLGREGDAAGPADRRPLSRHRASAAISKAAARARARTSRLVLETDGSVSVYVGSSSVGQGVETVFAQIAADALELPMARIRGVHHGSTDYVRRGLRLLQLALDRDGRLGHRGGGRKPEGRDSRRGGAAARLRAQDDRASTAARAIGPGQAVDRAAAISPRRASRPTAPTRATSAPTATARTRRMSRSIPSTGQVALLDYVAVEDVGRIINPLTLHGQTVGAIVQGLGGALLEHLSLRRERPAARPARSPTICCRPRATSRPSAPWRSRTSPRRTIRSAPRARARAASSRSAA